MELELFMATMLLLTQMFCLNFEGYIVDQQKVTYDALTIKLNLWKAIYPFFSL